MRQCLFVCLFLCVWCCCEAELTTYIMTEYERDCVLSFNVCTIFAGHCSGIFKRHYCVIGLTVTVVQKNCHPFSFHYSFYKCRPFSIIFGTHYTELICNITIIDLSTSPMYCCCTTLQRKSVAKIITLPNKLYFFVIQTKNTQFIHTTSLHLTQNITTSVQNVFFIHTGLKSLAPFINSIVHNALR